MQFLMPLIKALDENGCVALPFNLVFNKSRGYKVGVLELSKVIKEAINVKKRKSVALHPSSVTITSIMHSLHISITMLSVRERYIQGEI